MVAHDQVQTSHWQQDSVVSKGVLKSSSSKLGKTAKLKYDILVYIMYDELV